MSFVYAEKANGTLSIHCDTKLAIDRFAEASFSHEQKGLIRKYGIVKTTIICPEIGISFAGNNIFLASKLFRQLYAKRVFTTQEVVDMAFNIHTSGNTNDIEFIISSCEDGTLSLHCIKDGYVQKDCSNAWIGSFAAFREFQQLRLNNNDRKTSDKTSLSFLETIQSCSDDSVGGFHIIAGFNTSSKTMEYSMSKTFQDVTTQTIKAGEKFRFYTSASDGGFSFEQIPISLEDLMLEIDQMESVILYSRRLRVDNRDMNNPQLFSLMLPMLIREDGNGGWKRIR